jgi:hypothetical protein
MEAIFYYIKKTICLVLCLQIILVNLPIISSLKMGATKYSFLNKEKSENDLMDNNSEEQDVPEKEDESKDEKKNIDNKIFNTYNKELALLNIQKIVFELCNSKDKIQFHPEFSTPPPKYNAC